MGVTSKLLSATFHVVRVGTGTSEVTLACGEPLLVKKCATLSGDSGGVGRGHYYCDARRRLPDREDGIGVISRVGRYLSLTTLYTSYVHV